MKTQRKRIVSFIESLLISALLCAVLAAGIQLETPQVQALSQGMQQVMAARQRRLLIPGGDVFGIKVYALGVMVVGTAEVETEQGQVNPAAQAGIRVKDVITCVDGEPIRTVEKLMQRLQDCDGSPITLTLKRKDESVETVITPVWSAEGKYQVGLWVRDSTAGIGTMTFYDPATDCFGGLGHAICDVDTGEVIPIDSGVVIGAKILDVRRGVRGTAGELSGMFDDNVTIGTLRTNCEAGIFGRLSESSAAEGEAVPIAFREEIREGAATVICAASGKPEEYAIQINRVLSATGSGGKSMVIQVTDDRLIALTGGIVQGMSGSPILQDGRLVGAVTHVLVGDPTKGYGIFIESMLEAAA
ncbi:MAG: SpoIVB peptidase [Clostridia bacterium]|nr:SpoIVB peptidase [Clostridia bacterium]